MADPVRFAGFNTRLNPAKGTEHAVRTLPTFSNGREHISCWRLDPHELAEINRTGEVWVSVASGETAPPIFVSGGQLMQAFDPDTGQETAYYSDGRQIVEDARQFATLHHGDQKYGGGNPYAYHLGKVAEVLSDFGADWMYLASAWLHDTEEDCWQDEPIEARRERIRARYGDTVEGIVWACTGQMFIDGVKQNRAARNAEQYAKIAAFPTAAPTKYADRIANMEACVDFENLALGRMYANEAEGFDSKVGPYVPEAMRLRLRAVLEQLKHLPSIKEKTSHVPA